MRITLAIAMLFVSTFAVAECPKGSIDDGNGTCAAMPSPSEQALAPVIASNEKPSKHPESAWERGEVHADMPPVETVEQEKANIVAWDKKAEKDQR